MKKKFFGVSIIFASAFATVLVITVIFVILIGMIAGGWKTLSWEFLTAAPSNGMMSGGIFPALVGTVLLVLVMTLACVPVGTITAIYLSEYSKEGSFFTKLIRFAVNTLAGVPAIVFGLFGLGFFVQFVGSGMDSVFSRTGDLRWGQPNLLWASLTMALLTLPVVIVSVEEALHAVPKELRAASLALGATKFQTTIKVVLPNAMTGIFTGGILAVGRGAGEVAPILFTGVAYFLPQLPHSLSDQFMQLGYHLYVMSTQSPDVNATIGIQYASATVLLGLTFLLNFFAIILRYNMRVKHG